MSVTDQESAQESLSSSFLVYLGEALDDEAIIKKFQSIMTPLLKPLSDALTQANATIASLRKRIDEKDNAIANLEQQVRDLDIRVDDLEQQGRRGSMRVFGIPEDTPGSVDLKILTLCNKQMKVSPPLTLEDLEVVHRLGKPLPGRAGSSDVPDDVTPVPTPGSTPTDADLQSEVPVSGDAVQTAPLSDQVSPSPTTSRPVLVKFASRRTKARVMSCKKELKSNPCKRPDGTLSSVYVSDDLTKRRAGFAYRARMLKRDGAIADTWTFDSKVLVKDKHNRIYPIMKEEDLRKYETH